MSRCPRCIRFVSAFEVIIQRFADVALSVLVGSVALIAPISTSLYVARRQSLAAERLQALRYARDVMRRTVESREEFRLAANELQRAGLPACSAAEIDVMRGLDLASSYVQALGRIEGDKLTCTSLGTTLPLDVGASSAINEGGAAERFNVRVSLASAHPLTIVSIGGVAALLDPYLLVNTPTEGPDISIAVFVPSMASRGLIAKRGNAPDPASLQPIAKGEELTVVDKDSIVSRIRSREFDFEVVVKVPIHYANRRVRQFAIIFVPIGLLCGAGLVWAVVSLARQRLSMHVLLRAAARRREFFVEYQPVVELATNRWAGVEALVRWKRDGHVIGPDLFIPIAEEGGIVTLITECVALAIAADLPKLTQIDPDFKVAMNLSIADLHSPRTIGLLKQTVDAAGSDFRNLELEVTERGFLEDSKTSRLLDEIRTLGITVAIDDFGTGYSSLSCLQSLRIDKLKIDKTFVNTIGKDGVTSHVVHHIIDMAHSLGLKMVAEGVETEEQLLFLQERGVQYAQGWYFAKPMSLAALRESLPAHLMSEEVVCDLGCGGSS